jgi:hypothetical protein
MRGPERLKSLFAVALLAVVMIGFAPAACKARNLSQPDAETGYPQELINRPVCWRRSTPDDRPCGAIELRRQGARSPFD